MSLAIDVDEVTDVLLADGWHVVCDESFSIDTYEYIWSIDGGQPFKVLLAGGTVAGIPSAGASWKERDGGTVYCPLTSILAVNCRQRRPD